jgi:hypothetical protein
MWQQRGRFESFGYLHKNRNYSCQNERKKETEVVVNGWFYFLHLPQQIIHEIKHK